MAASLAAELQVCAEALKARDIPIEKLRHELAGMRRRRFGARPEALAQLQPAPNARRDASAYTLIETAKLNGVDPRAWIADTLNRIQDYKTNRIHKLMPWNWKRKTPP